jgi:hypothetical protein
MTHFLLPLPHHSYEFDGRRVAGPVDNRKSDSGWMRPRWLYLRLLRSDAGVYFVERVAHSVVAHEVDAPCVAEGKANERGEIVPVAMLPDDVVSCDRAPGPSKRRCHPDLTAGDVRLEQPLVTIFRSEDPADIIRWLTEAHHSKGGTSDMESRPVGKLLEEARRKDQAFRIHPVRRIA